VVQFLSDDGFRQEFERRAQTTISKYFSPAACYGPLGEHIFKASS